MNNKFQKYFETYEVASSYVCNINSPSTIYGMFDERLKDLIVWVREGIGRPMYANNWILYEKLKQANPRLVKFEQRGIRVKDDPDCKRQKMEPFTYNDCLVNFLKYKPDLLAKILNVSGLDQFPDEEEMVNNDVFAACMCRVRYLRAPGAIPKTIEGQAAYWKQHYNTVKGKGTVDEYLKNWERFCE